MEPHRLGLAHGGLHMVGMIEMDLWLRTKERSCEACIALDGTLWPVGVGPMPTLHKWCGCFRLRVRISPAATETDDTLNRRPPTPGMRLDRARWLIVPIGISVLAPGEAEPSQAEQRRWWERAASWTGGTVAEASDTTANLFQRGSDELGGLFGVVFDGPPPTETQPYSLRAGVPIVGPALIALETAIRKRREQERRQDQRAGRP